MTRDELKVGERYIRITSKLGYSIREVIEINSSNVVSKRIKYIEDTGKVNENAVGKKAILSIMFFVERYNLYKPPFDKDEIEELIKALELDA